MTTKNDPSNVGEAAVLVISRVFDAPRELVFKLWSNPEFVKRWWHPRGFTTPSFEMDFGEGGTYRYCIRADGRDSWVQGTTYREITAPDRLVFTFRWDSGDVEHDADTLVTVTFAPQGSRQTLLTFCASQPNSIARPSTWSRRRSSRRTGTTQSPSAATPRSRS